MDAAEFVEGAEARASPLPPWSPGRTPIVEMISKIKCAMRSEAGRTTEAVSAAFASALHDASVSGLIEGESE
jgi:hypothetical protein